MAYPVRGTQALRIGRVTIVGQIYIVTTSTNRRQPLFADFWTGRVVVRTMREIDVAGLTTTLAYVVMPDHLHWLLELRNSRLDHVVQILKGRSAYALRLHRPRPGQVWQHGFHDHALRNDERVTDAARYIIANPVRAGIVRRVGNYPLWDCVWI